MAAMRFLHADKLLLNTLYNCEKSVSEVSQIGSGVAFLVVLVAASSNSDFLLKSAQFYRPVCLLQSCVIIRLKTAEFSEAFIA